MSAHFQPEERSNFRNNGSHSVRRFRTDVAFAIHMYGLPTSMWICKHYAVTREQ